MENRKDTILWCHHYKSKPSTFLILVFKYIVQLSLLTYSARANDIWVKYDDINFNLSFLTVTDCEVWIKDVQKREKIHKISHLLQVFNFWSPSHLLLIVFILYIMYLKKQISLINKYDKNNEYSILLLQCTKSLMLASSAWSFWMLFWQTADGPGYNLRDIEFVCHDRKLRYKKHYKKSMVCSCLFFGK